jgi:hypothetical protein
LLDDTLKPNVIIAGKPRSLPPEWSWGRLVMSTTVDWPEKAL